MTTLTENTNITTLTASEIAALTISQIKSLTTTQLTNLVASQLSLLPAEKIAVLGLAFIEPSVLTGIPTSQINGLAVKNLSVAQIQALLTEQIQALTAKKLANFSSEQLTHLTDSQLAVASVGALNSEHISALPAEKFSALGNNFAALSLDALAGLTSSNITGLTSAQINMLSSEQYAVLKPSQLNALSISQFSNVNSSTLAAISPETLKAINVSISSNIDLTPQQISALTPEKFADFTPLQLSLLTAAQATVLRPSQIAALSTEQTTAFSTDAIAALKPHVMKSLKLNAFDSTDIAALTDKQVAHLTIENAQQLANNAQGLSASDIASMKTNTLLAMSNDAKDALSTLARAAYDGRFNTAPTATNLNAEETYTEDTALNLTDIIVTDSDSANVAVTLTLSNAAAGSLASGSVVSSAGVWTASGTVANVNTLLAALIFTPAANFNDSFSVTTSVSDGITTALTGTKNFTGVTVNDAPKSSLGSLVYETVTPKRDASGNIVYSVNESSTFASTPFSRVHYRMETTVNGTPYYADTSFDAWPGLTVADLAIPNQNSTTIFQRNVSNLTVNSNYPTVQNGSGFTGRLEIWQDSYLAALGNTNVGGSNTTFDFDDSLNSTHEMHWGSFQVHNLSAATPQTVLAWNGQGNTGYPAEIGFGNNPTGQPDWTFSTSPPSGTNGTSLGTTNWKLQIYIENGGVTFNEDTTKVFAVNDFGYSDAEGTSMAKIKILALPSLGSLTYNNGTNDVVVTMNQEISATDITAGKLKYTPLSNANGTNYSNFSFAVSDGSLYSTVTSMMLNVAAVNDTPISIQNLLTNGGAESGSLTGWTAVNGGSPWIASGSNYWEWADQHSGNYSFLASYSAGSLTQEIDLLAKGYSATYLDSAPILDFGAYVKGCQNPAGGSFADTYRIKIDLLDANHSVIASYDSNQLTATNAWELKSGSFSDYAAGARYAKMQLLSVSDAGNWAGNYGVRFDDAFIQLRRDPVIITGTSTQNQTLTADTSGLSDADGLGTLNYQWKKTIAGVTTDIILQQNQNFLPLTQAEVGAQISVTVSYTDGGGTTESVTSAATSAVISNTAPIFSASSTTSSDKANYFNGSNGYLINRSIQNDFTIEFWMKTTTTGGGPDWWLGRGLVDAETPAASNDFGMSLTNSTIGYGTGPTDVTIHSTSSVTTGGWIHIAATRVQNTGTMTLYVNGSLEASYNNSSTATLTSPSQIGIGRMLNGGLPAYIGDFDELRIWNYARSQAQIQGAMNGKLQGNEAGLVNYDNYDSTGSATGKWSGVYENSPTNLVIYDANASDVDGNTLTYSLKQTGDYSLLNINSATGEVKFNNSPDYETKNSYTFTVQVSDGYAMVDGSSVTVSIIDIVGI